MREIRVNLRGVTTTLRFPELANNNCTSTYHFKPIYLNASLYLAYDLTALLIVGLFRICATLIPPAFILTTNYAVPFMYIFNQTITNLFHREGAELALCVQEIR